MQKIKRKKVNQAIEALRIHRQDELKKHSKLEKAEKSESIHAHCKVVHNYKRHEQYFRGLSKHRILCEIKSHINKRNWDTVKNLLLLLLQSSSDIEPLIWRYIFILTLYSNIDNLSNIFQFFKTCVGSQHSDTNIILRNILLLPQNK
ncbi:uncharacterized protein LOC143424184 [Xylocopa sonorina]|uniref:uncharacterized protein LOC143424184 n=1 Tax=Xylocopa sonorina TaxID=1818115 RepID=UPI00403A84A8